MEQSPPQPAPPSPSTRVPAAAAAADSPSLPQPSSLPPYPEMIYSAITALKERDGSSKRAIAKYIETTYKGLDPSHATLLSNHLHRLKANGLLVMYKKSYRLPEANSTIAPNPDVVNIPSSDNANQVPKRGRGRPPKSNHSHPEAVLVKRGRGRPPKMKRSVGRPRKLKSVLVVNAGGKRRPGRPRKNPHGISSAVIPYANNLASAGAAALDAPFVFHVVPRPRGRPRKNMGPAAVFVAGGKLPVRRPGRPRKIGSGRPVGRPRKDLHQYTELRQKLEFFQSKVMQAVVALKPLFPSDTASSAGAAVQDLEGLAAMDINVPLGGVPQLPHS